MFKYVLYCINLTSEVLSHCYLISDLRNRNAIEQLSIWQFMLCLLSYTSSVLHDWQSTLMPASVLIGVCTDIFVPGRFRIFKIQNLMSMDTIMSVVTTLAIFVTANHLNNQYITYFRVLSYDETYSE